MKLFVISEGNSRWTPHEVQEHLKSSGAVAMGWLPEVTKAALSCSSVIRGKAKGHEPVKIRAL